MATSEILTIIGLGLLYGTALIGTYINIKIKIKELEVNIMTLQKEFDINKKEVDADIKRLEDKNTAEHEVISNKIDILIDRIADLRVHQAANYKDQQKHYEDGKS